MGGPAAITEIEQYSKLKICPLVKNFFAFYFFFFVLFLFLFLFSRLSVASIVCCVLCKPREFV